VARTKTTEMSTITAAQLADGDWVPVIDVSDTTMSSTGTNKKLAKSQLAEAAGVTAHLADTSDAHDASAISFSATGNIVATDVQAAIAELDSEKAAVAEPIAAAHIADTSAAHAASAVSFSATGSISSTDVQAAIAEVDSDLTAHTGDTSDAHDASAISVLDTAGNYTATDVEAVLAEAPKKFASWAYAWNADDVEVMSSPPTVGSEGSSTTITSAKLWPPNDQNAATDGSSLAQHFAAPVGHGWIQSAATFPNYLFVGSKTTTDPVSGGSFGYSSGHVIEFYHYDTETKLELIYKSAGGEVRVFVDGRPVGTSPTWTIGTGGGYAILPLTFASSKVRRIRVESSSGYFGGAYTGPNGSIWPAETALLPATVIGDSFSEPSGVSWPRSWCMTLGRLMGWNVTPSGLGGTGYLNPGSGGRVKFGDRLANDLVASGARIAIFAGGLNDYGSYTDSAIGTAAASCFATATAAGMELVVVSPFWKGGVETFVSNLLASRTAIRTACEAAGGTFIDLLEMPLRGQSAQSTTMAATANSSATTVSLTAAMPVGATISLGGTDASQRRVVTAVSGSGPYSHTVAALSSQVTSGTTVALVGPCFWTGSGKVGSTTGSGNCDLFVASDGTHPTAAGQDALAHAIASILRYKHLRKLGFANVA